MKNRIQQYIFHLFIQPYDGTQGRLANQLIYSQLKNRLVMMTQKPSSMLAKWKYAGVLPLLLMTLLIFSFRAKEKQQNLLSEWKYNSLSTQLPVDFTKTFNEYSEIKSVETGTTREVFACQCHSRAGVPAAGQNPDATQTQS